MKMAPMPIGPKCPLNTASLHVFTSGYTHRHHNGQPPQQQHENSQYDQSPNLNRVASKVYEPNLPSSHASLGDFPLDKARSGKLFIDAQEAHAHLARYCIKQMPMTFLTIGMLNVFVLSVLIFIRVCCRVSNGPAAEVLRSLSHRTLLEQCRKAYPRKELLRDLGNFNFEVFLNYGVDYFTEDLSLFFEWIKEQVCPDLK
jgi:hypothetical protein